VVDIYVWTASGMVPRTVKDDGVEYIERSEYEALVRTLREVDGHLDHFTPTVPKPSSLHAALRATSDTAAEPKA
jgi:hypothetical protein